MILQPPTCGNWMAYEDSAQSIGQPVQESPTPRLSRNYELDWSIKKANDKKRLFRNINSAGGSSFEVGVVFQVLYASQTSAPLLALNVRMLALA